jgi:hypothetical protein
MGIAEQPTNLADAAPVKAGIGLVAAEPGHARAVAEQELQVGEPEAAREVVGPERDQEVVGPERDREVAEPERDLVAVELPQDRARRHVPAGVAATK